MGQLEDYYTQFGKGVQGGNSNFDQLAALGARQNRSVSMVAGSKPLVVCGGAVTEVKDLDEAQRVAEEQAHAKSANAYILKPIKMVAPKRDVITTEIP